MAKCTKCNYKWKAKENWSLGFSKKGKDCSNCGHKQYISAVYLAILQCIKRQWGIFILLYNLSDLERLTWSLYGHNFPQRNKP
ncbi:hypothetical protein BpOF4_21684 (plasmid) [Alkalihalophilus pseudofirmus OF4]|uniref:Uncharacterized protein n=1 Tax=Alkalihalophilus pseudofirmus (strain ATCC BAA-2126 / JCM 17055 / OF4) TaxID=398511 RepID=D3G1V6_ALKPO|nr:hypothetical protein BpOF4_21684 [Alkalihalophilus pseudofirmus OF4]